MSWLRGFGKAREIGSIREHLAQSGSETRPVFYPVHTMTIYSQKYQKHQVSR